MAAATATAATAALQQTPIAFRSSSPLSSQLNSRPSTKLSLSSNLKIPKLTVKLLCRRVRSRGASGARMSDAAASYATALADVATANNTLDQTYSDVDKLGKLLADETVLNYFINPTIGVEEKSKLVDDIAKSLDLQPHVSNFLNILIDMKRIDLIGDIFKEFEIAYNKLTETELAVVTSVVQLDPPNVVAIAKVVQKLTGSKYVRIKTVLDPSLVAGFTIRYGDSGSKFIDMSVKKQLEDIAAQLDIGDVQLVV